MSHSVGAPSSTIDPGYVMGSITSIYNGLGKGVSFVSPVFAGLHQYVVSPVFGAIHFVTVKPISFALGTVGDTAQSIENFTLPILVKIDPAVTRVARLGGLVGVILIVKGLIDYRYPGSQKPEVIAEVEEYAVAMIKLGVFLVSFAALKTAADVGTTYLKSPVGESLVSDLQANNEMCNSQDEPSSDQTLAAFASNLAGSAKDYFVSFWK